jgi:hypothetical protein
MKKNTRKVESAEPVKLMLDAIRSEIRRLKADIEDNERLKQAEFKNEKGLIPIMVTSATAELLERALAKLRPHSGARHRCRVKSDPKDMPLIDHIVREACVAILRKGFYDNDLRPLQFMRTHGAADRLRERATFLCSILRQAETVGGDSGCERVEKLLRERRLVAPTERGWLDRLLTRC